MSYPTLDQVMNDLRDLLGIGVHLYEKNGHSVAHYSPLYPFCCRIHTAPGTTSICEKFDKVCFDYAADHRSTYIQKCPFGVYTVVSPICKQGELLGYLLLDGILDESKEAQNELIQNALHFLPEEEQNIRNDLLVYAKMSGKQIKAIESIAVAICHYIEYHNLFPTDNLSLGALTKCYINYNLQKKLTLKDICEHLHYSKSTITSAFQQEYGMTILTYINQERLNLACNLLKTTDMQIYQISSQCGFSSAEYFSYLFKNEFHCSPGSYRKRNLSN